MSAMSSGCPGVQSSFARVRALDSDQDGNEAVIAVSVDRRCQPDDGCPRIPATPADAERIRSLTAGSAG
jgi:hypothetical protein